MRRIEKARKGRRDDIFWADEVAETAAVAAEEVEQRGGNGGVFIGTVKLREGNVVGDS